VFFIYGGKDISKTVASIDFIFSGNVYHVLKSATDYDKGCFPFFKHRFGLKFSKYSNGGKNGP
jgi:hypothetical protein